jgi:hypothetical protein
MQVSLGLLCGYSKGAEAKKATEREKTKKKKNRRKKTFVWWTIPFIFLSFRSRRFTGGGG